MKLPKRAYWAVIDPWRRAPELYPSKRDAADAASVALSRRCTIHRVRLVAVGAGEKKKAVRRG